MDWLNDMHRVVSILVACLLLAGCSGVPESSSTTDTPFETPEQPFETKSFYILVIDNRANVEQLLLINISLSNPNGTTIWRTNDTIGGYRIHDFGYGWGPADNGTHGLHIEL